MIYKRGDRVKVATPAAPSGRWFTVTAVQRLVDDTQNVSLNGVTVHSAVLANAVLGFREGPALKVWGE
jgi:hypothetical protein